MKQKLGTIWARDVLPYFLAGLFLLLPVFLTLWVISWILGLVRAVAGEGTAIGRLVESLGLVFFGSELLAYGLVVLAALGAIWAVGVFAVHYGRLEALWHEALSRIPVVGSIYRPIARAVRILRRDGTAELSGMKPVVCALGEGGPSALGLSVSDERFEVRGKPCRLVFFPTTPVPMTGALLFVPEDLVEPAEGVEVEDLVQVFLSLGTLAVDVVPARMRGGHQGIAK